ncbi:MAG: DNA repair protein RadC [Candidatus Kryptonium sp.]
MDGKSVKYEFNEDYKIRIKDLPAEARPREKFIKYGPRFVSNAELLAILIGSGTKKVSALDLANKILSDAGSLRELARKDLGDLKKYKGIGLKKAVVISAAFELSRRIQSEPISERPQITSPEDIAKIFIPRLSDLNKEILIVVLLNTANRIIKEIVVSEGNLNSSVIHPREVFKPAIDELSASIILVHNHPSGNPEPSRMDIEVTKQIYQAGEIIGIKLLDHIIIAGDKFSSMARLGLLK